MTTISTSYKSETRLFSISYSRYDDPENPVSLKTTDVELVGNLLADQMLNAEDYYEFELTFRILD